MKVLTNEQLFEIQHEKYLSWFASYVSKVPGIINIDNYVGSRDGLAFQNLLESFNRNHPEANLQLCIQTDSEGSLYVAV